MGDESMNSLVNLELRKTDLDSYLFAHEGNLWNNLIFKVPYRAIRTFDSFRFFDSVPFASLCDNELFICRWMSCTWKAAMGRQTQPSVTSPRWFWEGSRRRRRRSGSSIGAGWTLRWSGSLIQCESTQIFTTHQCQLFSESCILSVVLPTAN